MLIVFSIASQKNTKSRWRFVDFLLLLFRISEFNFGMRYAMRE